MQSIFEAVSYFERFEIGSIAIADWFLFGE
jgi:hypothetical protein